MGDKADFLFIPVKLDACVINQNLCGEWPKATLAPISQPNFTFLRTDSSLISPDVLPLHDMHNAAPANVNPRVYDLANSKPRLERQGVSLHWSLPKAYRSGTSSNKETSEQKDTRPPKFRPSPDRWLIIRKIHQDAGTFQPADAFSTGKLKPFTAWVIESNRLRNIQNMDINVDIELECAPFIQGKVDDKSVDGQAEIFIGNRVDLDRWTEESQTKKDEFVDLTVVGAANPLFADYTLHNSNVFSMFDNFNTYLTEGIISYHAIGWHANIGSDPIGGSDGSVAFSSILRDLNMKIRESDQAEFNVDVGQLVNPRILCHGSLYTVKYNVNLSGNISIPANEAGQKLGDPLSHPITIGTTPLESVLSYVRAHNATMKAKKDKTPQEEELARTEASILMMDTLLLKQEDDIDAQQEASDMLSANNFQPAQDSGYHWHFSAAGATLDGESTAKRTDKVFVPSEQQVKDLAALNSVQAALDSVTREVRLERWNLFAKWWQYIADPARQSITRRTDIIAETKQQATIVENLIKTKDRLTILVKTSLNPFGGEDQNKRIVHRGGAERFFTQKDPTILVPGMNNPWPADWLDTLQTRTNTQVSPSEIPNLSNEWSGLRELFNGAIRGRLPRELHKGINTLLAEFYTLSQSEEVLKSQKLGVLPLYHDHVEQGVVKTGLVNGSGRDRWNDTQPWFPLFLEWEIRYYHIDYDKWDFMEVESDPEPGKCKHWRYGVSQSLQGLADETTTQHVDQRVIGGRVLILPQPGFSIRTNMEQLFNTTARADLPDDLKYDPTKDTTGDTTDPIAKEKAIQTEFLNRIDRLNYLSAPMSGFQDHLITRLNGTHLKPSYRAPGKPIVPFQAAIEAARDGAGFGSQEISLMDIETDKVPFSNHIPFRDSAIAPLKPATHGQFKFTRLDIFDKFGQAISAINPTPTNQIPPLYPVLSEYFHPQHRGGPDTPEYAEANTVGKDPFGWCQFAQYPPNINQDARINSAFMHWDKDASEKGLWRPCTEWENPVWGYLVVNYAEYALQVFLPNGQFYREIRMGGPSGTTETPAWAPFEQPDKSLSDIYDDKTGSLIHLDKLLTKFKDAKYLQSFIQMINKSLGSVKHTPDSYAEYLTSIVGRPLALANIGYSLELAQPPFKNQSTAPNVADEPLKLVDYEFSVKLGDKDRAYDGLVGFFKSDDKTQFGDVLNLDTVYTYYPSGTKATQMIRPNTELRTKPYYKSSRDQRLKIASVNANATDGDAYMAANQLTQAHWGQMDIVGAIFDPFSKLHIYSGILPITTLQLPPWSLQSALQSMTAFFSMGPLIITSPDLQKQYKWERRLTQETNLLSLKEEEEKESPPDPTKPPAPPRFRGVPMPAIKSAEWNWLQPFYRAPPVEVQKTDADAIASGGEKVPDGAVATTSEPKKDLRETHWNPFVLTHLDNKPKFEPGPYTAIEGFLQLKKPLMEAVGEGEAKH